LNQCHQDPYRLGPIAARELLFRLIEHRDARVGRGGYDCLTRISPAAIESFEKQPVRQVASSSEDSKCQPRDDEKLHQVIHSAD
jgi:hypothetical protein